MEDLPVVMVLENLDDIPCYPLPQGYRIRKFRRGEERLWAEVEHAAGEFDSTETALARFRRDFGDRIDDLEDRCFFLVESESDRVIGTATAWFDCSFRGKEWGRVHWVAIIPEFQGRKLAKPLMSAVLERLKQSHARAYLKTHTRCTRAIKMYLDFGFRPLPEYPTCDRAWRSIAASLAHPALEEFRRPASEH